MIVLITGAFGFVGSNLSAFLAERGLDLWALDVPEAGCDAPAPYARRFTWDALDEIPWPQVDAIIHLAGKAHDTRNTGEAQAYFEINAGLTRRVLDAWRAGSAASDSPRRRIFILFSSVKAVADAVDGVLTEEAIPAPRTPYGESKLAAEREVLKFGSAGVRECQGATTLSRALSNREWDVPQRALGSGDFSPRRQDRQGCGKVLKFGSAGVREPVAADDASQADNDNFRTLELCNFRTYLLRPCMIHGPGNKGNLNLLYRVVSKGIPWPLGAYDNRRSFASIGNVCAVIEGLLSREVDPGVYQVADDEALATNDVIRLMAETLGRRARLLKIPRGTIHAMARVGDWLHLPLNSERLNKLTESYVVSNEKIKRALGWEQMPVGAAEGLRKTLEAMREL